MGEQVIKMAALTVQAARLCRQQCHGLGGVFVVQHRHTSQVAHGQTGNLAAYKRGKGGRSSFSGMVATVFGATGMLGRSVVNKLGKVGSQVICPYRGDAYFIRDCKLMGDLGQIYFAPFDLRDEDSLRECMKHSNVVVNCIGRDWETRNFSYEEVHVNGPRRMARAARELGVEKFIHTSHIGASPDPTPCLMKKGSQFLRSKYEGELAVMEGSLMPPFSGPVTCMDTMIDSYITTQTHIEGRWEQRYPSGKQVKVQSRCLYIHWMYPLQL